MKMRLVVFSMIISLIQVPVVNSQDLIKNCFLFSYFKSNGQDGLHLAFSEDGLKWIALNNDASFLTPEVGGKLMRDPSICQGADGSFHIVWTTGWWDKGIGLAHSKDLINWSTQMFLPVMQHEPEAKNCWAPEIFYDAKSQKYLIFWATTIPGRFPETEYPQDDNNHRIYYITTRDFVTYSDTKLFYEPGFNVIDSFVSCDGHGDRYVMFLKNETKYPKPEKNLRVAFSDDAEGPYGQPSPPITGNYWAEGPCALNIDGKWYVYFDKYRDHCYGAVASTDLVNWEDISDQISFPGGARHGTTFAVDSCVLAKVRDLQNNKDAVDIEDKEKTTSESQQ